MYDEKKLDMKLFFSWILCAASVFSCILIIPVFLKYINIGKQSFCGYLFSMSDIFIGVSFETLQNTYITISTCFVGIYFAILGIMMSNLKVSFVDFFKFAFDTRFLVFVFSIFIQFIEIVFIFPQIPYVIILEIFIYLFIIFLLVFIVLSIAKMSVLQNYKKCLNLFAKKSLKGNEEEIRDFYINFVCKCFPDKNIDILDDFFKELKNRKTNIDALSICLKLINSIESDKKAEYRAKMQFLARRIMDCIAMKNYNKIKELIATYFSVYRKLISSKKEKNYSYLLEIRDTVYFSLLDNRDNKDFQDFYISVMDGAKNIITVSLFNCPESVVYQEIKDFIYMKQLLNIGFKEICLHHSRILIDILCRVSNFVKINGKCISLLKSYINQLELVEKIFIYDIDTEQYQEEQVNTGFHEIKDTRNYYIALLLCYYCSRFGENKLDEVIKKLSYICYETKYQDLKYKNILDAFENITQDSFEKIFFIKKDKCNSVNTVRNKLSEHVNEIKTSQQEALRAKDVSGLLAKEIERQKEDAYKDFESYSKYDYKKETDYIVKTVKSNFSISKRSLIDDSRNPVGLNYCYYIEHLLYQNLTKILPKYEVEVKTIGSVLEIDGLDRGEKNVLLVPSDYRNYFTATNIHDIKYLDLNTIQVKDYIFNLEYFYASSGLIIKKSDFYSLISLKEIKVSDYDNEKWIEMGEDFVMNVDIEFVFAFDKTKKITMYVLEY